MKSLYNLNKDAISLRKELEIDLLEPIDLSMLISKIPDLTIIFIPMASTSGLCIKNNNIKLIGLNSNMRKGRLRFTFAHELYHLFIENNDGQPIICNNIDRNDSEIEADKFASYFLMTEDALKHYKTTNNITSWDLDDIIKAEQYFQISHEAFLIRLVKQGYITENEKKTLGNVRIISEAKKRDYPIDLYIPTHYENKTMVKGYYVSKIFDKEIINNLSYNKRKKLLIDAFREDLLFKR